MADVFTVLAKDHEEVKGMLAELGKGPTKATGASQDQLARRKKMTDELIISESQHEALEEMYFWPAVREHHAAGNTLSDEAIGQEQEAKEVLAKLDKLDASDAEFEELLGTFIGAAREHIEFEETEVWPGLRAVLPAETAAELGSKITEGKKTAPTRPHPHTPASPGVLKAAGPAAAAADKARDALTGRGSDQPAATTRAVWSCRWAAERDPVPGSPAAAAPSRDYERLPGTTKPSCTGR